MKSRYQFDGEKLLNSWLVGPKLLIEDNKRHYYYTIRINDKTKTELLELQPIIVAGETYYIGYLSMTGQPDQLIISKHHAK